MVAERAVLALELYASKQLETLLDALAAHDIEVVLLKGAAFWTFLYEPGERSVCDLDILVRVSDRPQVGRVLDQLGYHRYRNPRRPATERQFYQAVYVPGADKMGVPVEAHTCLTHPSRYGYDLEGLFSRAVQCTVGRSKALRLCAEDNLLHLAVHRTVHGFGFDEDLRNVADADRIISRTRVDWRALAERAHEWGCATALWILLDSARESCQSAVPREVLEDLQPGRIKAAYLYQVLRRHNGAWVFRWPQMSHGWRRGLLFLVVLDRMERQVDSAVRFAWLLGRDAWESRIRRESSSKQQAR